MKYQLFYFITNPDKVIVCPPSISKAAYILKLGLSEFTEDSTRELNDLKNKVRMSCKLFLINTYKTFKLQPQNEPSLIEYSPL